MLVSILVPIRSYNPRLLSSLDSLVDQTYAPYEIVIVLDDAEPKAFSLVQLWKERLETQIRDTQSRPYSPVLRLYKNPHPKNLSRALNFGVSKCSGEWIARADADDVYSPFRLEKQMHLVRELDYSPCLVAVSSNPHRINFKDSNQIILQPFDFLFDNPIIHSSVLIKREVLEANSYDEEFTFSQDYELWTRLVLKNTLIVTKDNLVDLDQSVRRGKYVLSQENFFLKANMRFVLRLVRISPKSIKYLSLLQALLIAYWRKLRVLKNGLRLKLGRW